MAGEKQEMTQDEMDDLIYAGATPYEDDENQDMAPEPEKAEDELEDPPAKEEEPVAETEEEPEAETEEEPEAETEEEPEAEEPEEPKAEKQHMIPKSRFDEINERRKAAERRAAELEAQRKALDPKAVSDFDFDGKEEEYAQKVLDGDFDGAKALRREIRDAEQAAFMKLAESQAKTVTDKTRQQAEFDTAVDELNAAYPAFDPNAEGYDKELVDEALDLHAGFVARGYEPAAALRKAVKYVAMANGLGATEAPAEEQLPTPSLKEAKASPKKADLSKKLAAAEKQPPKQQGRGMSGEAEIDLDSIPEEEFDALPESKLRALRGDMRL